MTTANKITILRILLIPFLSLNCFITRNRNELYRLLAPYVAVTAILDGVTLYCARYNKKASWAILDPLADSCCSCRTSSR